jgi:hypothetical protein
MKITSRGAALALLIGASPIAVLAAQAARDGGWGLSAESRERLQEGKLAAAKATLKLSPDQEKLWAPIEEQVRAQNKERADERAERRKKREERRAERDTERNKAGGEGKAAEGQASEGKAEAKSVEARQRPSIAERYERMAERMTKRADRMKAFSSAFTPFYASLSDEQKAVVGPVMRDLRVARMGGGKHGRRWHDGGWGEHWGGKHKHHGHHHKHGGHDHGEHGNGDALEQPGADPQKL